MLTMKVLVFSDSHSGLSFMRAAVKAVSPDAMIHLGDYYADGETIAYENPTVPMYQVPGNCDKYRVQGKPDFLCLSIFGALLYMVHGHNEGVKMSLHRLLADARAADAQAALYGHTHRAECHKEPDDLWVINPGSCESYSGSVALMTIEEGKIRSCRILTSDMITW